jgi:hypothetical protein
LHNPPSRSCRLVGDENITPEREYALLGWHLQEQVDVVRYRYKLGQSWSAQYGVVCSLEVRYDEIDVVDMKVVGGAELDC